jgi:formate hydrogenlyase transcriptional activator
VVAATDRDLETAIADQTFRSDLFYRLNVCPLVVPPLRERPEDIPLLVEYFTHRFVKRAGKRINKKTLSLLQLYGWPGNVRELQNVGERAVIWDQRIVPHFLPLNAPATNPIERVKWCGWRHL